MSIVRKVASFGIASAIAAGFVLQAGCSPYAYPNLMSVPAVRLDPGAEPVHAFRVEVTGHVANLASMTDDYTLSRIDRDPGGRLPAQSDVSLERGDYNLACVPCSSHRGKTLLVRLYRPGYDLVELRAGEGAEVAWMPATDLAGRERAIDGLLSRPAYDAGLRTILASKLLLPPGSRSAEHCKALLFAAAEYERLAATKGLPESDVARLLKKAADVRARAGQ